MGLRGSRLFATDLYDGLGPLGLGLELGQDGWRSLVFAELDAWILLAAFSHMGS